MVKCIKCKSEAIWLSHMHTLSPEEGGGKLCWYACLNLECGEMFLGVEKEGGNNNEN